MNNQKEYSEKEKDYITCRNIMKTVVGILAVGVIITIVILHKL